MLNHLGIFAVLVGFLAFAAGASPVGDLDEIAEINTLEGMVLIPAGSFEMGSTDAFADDDEQPVHTVHLDTFFMDKYEVTNAQFKAFVDANPAWQKDRIMDGFHDGNYLLHWNGTDYPAGKANHPVVYVSWYAAMAYAAWAGKDLPTEAEWEYAARGGLEGQKYPWGDNLPTPADANYGEPVFNIEHFFYMNSGFYMDSGTSVVGRYADNRYGLYDMAGNVWEWCLDEYDADFYAVSHASRNPMSGARRLRWILDNLRLPSMLPNPARVLRGGSWENSAHEVLYYLRVANRDGYSPTVTAGSVGFRCVRSVGFRCVRDVPR